jgi:pimeloyl-ACP methyl ester carboxylesterase
MRTAILALHGLNGTGAVWDRIAPALAADGRVVDAPTLFPDLRTTGPPPTEILRLGLGDYVRQAGIWADALTERTGRRPIVMGHSMGGLIAQKLASQGKTSGIVLVTPAAPADCAALSLAPLYTFWNLVAEASELRAFKVWERGFRWGVLNCVPPERHDAIVAAAVHDSGRVCAQLANHRADPDGTARIETASVTVPVLTLCGARDRSTVAASVRRIGRKYAATGTYIEYPEGGHWLVDEPATPRMLADIGGWLDRHGL